MISAKQIREHFLRFFQEKGHHIVPSAPIVVKNDPTLLFTNAGMNQFKDIFLGIKPAVHTRIADTQKCLRVSGKHNDLEEVGHDTYHHTMFEMLGNWSFGDYYKKDAIDWAWEFLTERLGLNPNLIYATVFEGDKKEKLDADEEAVEYWLKHLPQDRILRCGRKDNFWEMGETGPCGPCSEIHVDLRDPKAIAKKPGRELVNKGNPEVIEIWNLVFIQYNRKADGKLEELPAKHVDTGMGFERLTMALQGTKSTYDTDIFESSRNFLERKTGIAYTSASEAQQVAMRVVMDHIRAIVFAIGDGQIPSNTGAGYVIRRILRRASRYAYSYLQLATPFLHELVDLMAEDYKGVFNEVGNQLEFIKRIILEEEKGFLKKLESGSLMFEEYTQSHKSGKKLKKIDGDFAFKLYDTFGFPIDLTQVMAKERGLDIDMSEFERLLEVQKTRSRAAGELSAGDWVELHVSGELPRFVGYDLLEIDTQIRQYRTVVKGNKTFYQLVLDESPFYAEMGGQIGDKGQLSKGLELIHVLDTQKENELIVHMVDKHPADPSGSWLAKVDSGLRRQIKLNHTATHLLHAALRQVLGPHVEQRGSLVTEKALRFDFSHFAKMTDEELADVESIVNQKIIASIPLQEYRDVPIEEAKKMGAMALFGEKYGDLVRVIVFDPQFSVELCGGIHAAGTSDIRVFKIISEGSVAAGIRRLEAFTAEGALSFYEEKLQLLHSIGDKLKTGKRLDEAIEDLLQKQKSLERDLQQLNTEKLLQLKEQLLKEVKEVNGVRLISKLVQVQSAEDLKQVSFDLRKVLDNAVIVLGANIQEKPLLSVIVSEDLFAKGNINAQEMIKVLAKDIQGGGGGQPFYATAGGKDSTGLEKALAKVADLLS